MDEVSLREGGEFHVTSVRVCIRYYYCYTVVGSASLGIEIDIKEESVGREEEKVVSCKVLPGEDSEVRYKSTIMHMMVIFTVCTCHVGVCIMS